MDLAVAPQGHGLDADGELGDPLRALFREHGVRQPPQLAYVSEATYPGEDLVPGHHVEGFSEAWDAVIAAWRCHERQPPGPGDRFHVETHVMEDRDVFVTDDEALLTMCARLREEHGVAS